MKLLEKKKFDLNEIPILKNYITSLTMKNILVTIILFSICIVVLSFELSVLLLIVVLFLWVMLYIKYYLITRDKLFVIKGLCIKDMSKNNIRTKQLFKFFKLPTTMTVNSENMIIKISADSSILNFDNKNVLLFVHPWNMYEYEDYIEVRNIFFICESNMT